MKNQIGINKVSKVRLLSLLYFSTRPRVDEIDDLWGILLNFKLKKFEEFWLEKLKIPREAL